MTSCSRRWHTGFGFGDEDLDEFMEWMERWSKTNVIEEVAAPESTAACTMDPPVVETITQAGSTVQKQTAVETQVTAAGGEPGQTGDVAGDSMESGSSYTKTTKVTTTRTERAIGSEGPVVSETVTAVETGGEGSFGSGFSESTTTTKETVVSGSSGGERDQTVTQTAEGSFGSGFSETTAQSLEQVHSVLVAVTRT